MNRDDKNAPQDDKYPGYPHQPADEDITLPSNNNGKENLGYEEDTAPSRQSDRTQVRDTPIEEEDTDIVMGTEADVTAEDLELLDDGRDSISASSLDRYDAEGELLNEASDGAGADLDVPGSEEDDSNEEIGEEDEENNYYSLGGDKEDMDTEGNP